jgi:hypothetical protein
VRFALLDQTTQVGCRLPLRGGGNGPTDSTGQGLGFFLDGGAFAQDLLNRRGVEVDIGDCSEEPLDHEAVDPGILLSGLARLVGPEGDAFQAVDEQVLQGGHIRLLAADADLGAARSLGGLFTLVTEHVLLLVGGVGFALGHSQKFPNAFHRCSLKGSIQWTSQLVSRPGRV